MPNVFKKLTLILLSTVLFLNSMAMPFAVANAQDAPSPWYSQSIFEWMPKVYDKSNPSEIFGERYTAAQTQWVMWGVATAWLTFLPGPAKDVVICAIGGTSGGSGDICASEMANFYLWLNDLTVNSANSNIANQSFLDTISNNPISGIGYVKDVVSRFNPVTEVNAQGYGFNTGADSIKMLWQATRNISYALIVLAVIVMAFMIMFRVKMSPQLVISVQSALPNIIFTVVLITFSYAIAGFVIDLMYVVIGLIASLLVSGGFTSHTFTEMFGELNLTHSAFALMYKYWILFVVQAIVVFFINITSALMGLFLIIFAILSIFAVVFWSIKIIYVLLKNFAMVVLTIAIGPLEILMGAFTGKSTFGGWLKKLISYLAVYPLMGIMFFFSFYFLFQGSKTDPNGNTSLIPFNPVADMITNNTWHPPFSGLVLGDNILWVVVSFVIFSNATKVVEIIQGMITGKGFAFGTGIGETFGRDNFIWGNTGANVGESIKRNRQEAFGNQYGPIIQSYTDKFTPKWFKNAGKSAEV